MALVDLSAVVAEMDRRAEAKKLTCDHVWQLRFGKVQCWKCLAVKPEGCAETASVTSS